MIALSHRACRETGIWRVWQYAGSHDLAIPPPGETGLALYLMSLLRTPCLTVSYNRVPSTRPSAGHFAALRQEIALQWARLRLLRGYSAAGPHGPIECWPRRSVAETAFSIGGLGGDKTPTTSPRRLAILGRQGGPPLVGSRASRRPLRKDRYENTAAARRSPSA
jgi:hypothetical protein